MTETSAAISERYNKSSRNASYGNPNAAHWVIQILVSIIPSAPSSLERLRLITQPYWLSAVVKLKYVKRAPWEPDPFLRS